MLSGVRVLDVSRVLAGPLCAQHLADLGAAVMRVERKSGDETRTWGPPFDAALDASDEGVKPATYYRAHDRGKELVRLDLASSAGGDAFRKLAADADVVVENFSERQRQRLGLADVAAVAPRAAAWVSIRSGLAGPAGEELPAYDYAMQAMSGLLHVTGSRTGVAVVDQATGFWAAQAALAALVARGRGTTAAVAKVEVALYDVAMAQLAYLGTAWLKGHTDPAPVAGGHGSIVPYDLFSAADGAQLVVLAANDASWRRLCDAAGTPELVEAYPSNATRVAHRDAVTGALQTALDSRPRAEWLGAFAAAGVAAAPVRTVREALESAETRSRGLIDATGRVAPPVIVNGERVHFPGPA